MARDERAVALRFRADDRRAETGANQILERVRLRRAVVDPHVEPRKLRTQAAERGEVVPLALDRIEIGDIKGRKRIDREEAAHDRDGVADRRQRRFERPVGRAFAHSRADDLAAHEIDDRDGLQAISLRSS